MSVPWYLMAKGKGGGGYKTASGPIVSINDALAAPLRSLSIGIDPVQSGSGDPSPDNVRPITGWSAANLWKTGKNLLDVADYQIQTVSQYNRAIGTTPTYGGTGASVSGTNPIEIAVNTGWRGATFFSKPLKAGTSYYLRYRISAPSPGYIKRSIYFVDSNNTIVVLHSSSSGVEQDAEYVYHNTLTSPQDGLRIAFVVESQTQQTITIYDMGVMVGDWETYAPYSGNQYTIQLGQTVYGGTLDVLTGVLTVDRAMVLASTLSWTLSGTDSFYATKTDKQRGLNTAICTHFSSRTYSSSDRILIENTGITSKDDLYAYFGTQEAASTPVQLVYELATPITIPLTATQISTLQGQNVVWADAGDVTLEYLAAGGADPDLMKLAVAFMGKR